MIRLGREFTRRQKLLSSCKVKQTVLQPYITYTNTVHCKTHQLSSTWEFSFFQKRASSGSFCRLRKGEQFAYRCACFSTFRNEHRSLFGRFCFTNLWVALNEAISFSRSSSEFFYKDAAMIAQNNLIECTKQRYFYRRSHFRVAESAVEGWVKNYSNCKRKPNFWSMVSWPVTV